MFDRSHWQEFTRQGYTVVSGAIDHRRLQAAQAAGRRLNEIFPNGGWERTRDELWREARCCRDDEFMAIVSTALDPLAAEILDSAPPVDFVQLASTMPGFTTKGGIGRNFHIDGGKEFGVFNILLGVALTDVASDTVGGFHVLPGSHEAFARAFRRQHWGNVRLQTMRRLLPGARLVVPRLAAGDIIVAHSFLAHGTSANSSDVRRDMIFQRRPAAPLCDPSTGDEALKQFMQDPWAFFRSPPEFTQPRALT
ncbi:phytanoyl-CoA dioxygenase family protein [Bradyrhizobium sp. DASA03120]|uniref:phytanoyl-CoA dioxygenase family protein n=1 Tax=Bradyrhizobium sp. SMVTL-02 TaxID=3395917 RepID=UPI003F73060C